VLLAFRAHVSDPADEVAEIWLALTDEQRDDLLTARNTALRTSSARQQKGHVDEPE
jgi:hypothetical protein